MHTRPARCALVVVIILNGLMAITACSSGIATRDVGVVRTSSSPNKSHLATVYVVSAGGAAGYAYRLVNIRGSSDPFDPEKGIVFQMTGAGELDVMWEDDEHLTVKHPKSANVYTQAMAWGSERKVQISYVPQ